MTNRAVSTGPYLAYFVVFAAMAVWTASHLFPPVNLDVGALLYIAARWVAGDRLYIDVIDPNTPWAIALHVPAVVSADLFGLDAPTWFSIYVVAAIVAALGLSHLVLKPAGTSALTLVKLALPMAGLFVLGVLPGSSFGQREHLLLIGAFPYLVLAGLRADGMPVGLPLKLAVAVFAGLAFAIKPYFVFPLVLVEAYLLIRRGPRATFSDPVPWTIGGLLVLHVVLAVLLTPQYFSFILPFAAATYENPLAGIRHAWGLLLGPDLGAITVILPVLTLFAFFWRGSSVPRAIALFAIGMTFAAVVQGKGWDYQALPAVAGTLLLGLALVAAVIERYGVGSTEATAGAAALVAACLMLPMILQAGLRLRPFREQMDFSASDAGRWLQFLDARAGNHRTMVLSDGMYPQFPAITYAEYKMTMPFLTMWPLAGLYDTCEAGGPRYRPIAAQTPAEAFVYKTVVDGFVTEKPDFLVIDRHPGIPSCAGQDFDYLTYFMRSDRFASAFRNYHRLATLEDRYDFFVPN